MARGLSIDDIKTGIEIANGIIDWGANGYLGCTLFGFATVGLAKILMKTLTKQPTPKYTELLIFLGIGTVISILLKILKIDLLYKKQGFIIVLVINIISFLIVRYIIKRKTNCKNS